jgi:hypothetical protein
VRLPHHSLKSEAFAASIRITVGNFQLLNRLLAPNRTDYRNQRLATQVTKTVVEAARETLVIGQA